MPYDAKAMIAAIREAEDLASAYRVQACVVETGKALRGVVSPGKDDRVVVQGITPPLFNHDAREIARAAMAELPHCHEAFARMVQIASDGDTRMLNDPEFRSEVFAAMIGEFFRRARHETQDIAGKPVPSLWTRLFRLA